MKRGMGINMLMGRGRENSATLQTMKRNIGAASIPKGSSSGHDDGCYQLLNLEWNLRPGRNVLAVSGVCELCMSVCVCVFESCAYS